MVQASSARLIETGDLLEIEGEKALRVVFANSQVFEGKIYTVNVENGEWAEVLDAVEARALFVRKITLEEILTNAHTTVRALRNSISW